MNAEIREQGGFVFFFSYLQHRQVLPGEQLSAAQKIKAISSRKKKKNLFVCGLWVWISISELNPINLLVPAQGFSLYRWTLEEYFQIHSWAASQELAWLQVEEPCCGIPVLLRREASSQRVRDAFIQRLTWVSFPEPVAGRVLCLQRNRQKVEEPPQRIVKQN